MRFDSAPPAGALANPDTILQMRSSVVAGGPAHGCRAIDLRVLHGIDLRILPDRGLDIGAAWYRGVPLAWTSSVGEVGPLSDPRDMSWNDAFGGGLVTTCGLRNVGMPSEGHPLHGTYSHLRAGNVAIERNADRGFLAVHGVVDDAGALTHHLRLERVIRTWAGTGRVEIADRTANLGRERIGAPILYHINVGYPLWGPGGRLAIPATRTTARDEASAASLQSWQVPPDVDRSTERVLEHEVAPDDDGWGRAEITNDRWGLRLSVRWRMAELPRLHQWVHPAPGVYVLGIEPANCSTGGVAHDRGQGRLPELDPGEVRETELVIEARASGR